MPVDEQEVLTQLGLAFVGWLDNGGLAALAVHGDAHSKLRHGDSWYLCHVSRHDEDPCCG